MKDINALKKITNQGTGLFILLTFLTVGIYPIMWGWRNTNLFNEELDSKSASSSIFLCIAIAFGLIEMFFPYVSQDNLSYIMNDEPYYAEAANMIIALLFIGSNLLSIIWSFKIKGAIEDYTRNNFGFILKLNWFYTLFFQFFYINYCMNSLEDDLMKEKVKEELRKSKKENNPQAE